MSALFTVPALIGRTNELAAIASRLGAAAAGRGSLTLVAGEPGVGKTRLLSAVAETARAAGLTVLIGRAYDPEVMPPYLPFIEALRGYVRGVPAARLAALAGAGAGDLVKVVPDLGTRLPGVTSAPALGAEHERYRLFERIADFLIAIAEEGGLLLTLDDLQWADHQTLALLHHLARRLQDAPIAVAGAYRTVELGRRHPLAAMLAELRRERLAERVLLRPLSHDETRELIEGLMESPVPAETASALYRETGGNPFFVEEVVRHLLAEGWRAAAPPPALEGDWGIPEGIREVVGARLTRLGSRANQLLPLLAVAGDGVDADVLASATEPSAEAVVEALEDCLQAGVLREEGGGYHFAHTLIRQTVAAELSLPRRQALHARLVRAIETVHAGRLQQHVASLAMHARLAGAALDPHVAVGYAERAAAQAAALYAWEEAADHWRAVLDLQPEESSRARGEALAALGECLQRAGADAEARRVFEAAAHLARHCRLPSLLGRVALAWGLGEETGGVDNERTIALLEEADAALASDNSALHARVLARLAWQQMTPQRLEQRRALSAEAVAVARTLDDPRTMAFALNARHWGLCGPDTLAERLAIATEIVRLARLAADPELELGGHLWRLIDLLEAGDLSAADREIDAYAAIAEPLRQPYLLWYVPLFRAMRAMLYGRLADADRFSAEALAVGRLGQPDLAAQHHVLQRVHLSLERDQQLVAADLTRPLLETFVSSPNLSAILAYLLGEAGALGEARALYGPLAAEGFEGIVLDEDWLAAMVALGLTATRLGDQGGAVRLYDRLLPYASRMAVFGNAGICLGSVERILGLLAATAGRWEHAVRHLEAANAVHARLGLRSLLLHGRFALAHTLIAAAPGDPQIQTRVRALLADVTAGAEELGMARLLRRARTLAARVPAAGSGDAVATGGGRVRRPWLSPREVEVLRLLATGHTNQEIADVLVISVRTVERHIAHIYAKIGARGRAEATLYAVGHALIAPLDR